MWWGPLFLGPSLPCKALFSLSLGIFPVHLVDVFGPAAGLLCIKAAEVTFEGPVLGVDSAVYVQDVWAAATWDIFQGGHPDVDDCAPDPGPDPGRHSADT